MSISVVIIAHNEEKNIERCITSLMSQNIKADEIILVAHNCTDETIKKASSFPITIRPLVGTPGISYARHYGISQASGTKILCIDGDAHASTNWIESLNVVLDVSKSMMVGVDVVYTNNLFWFLIRPVNYIVSRIQRDKTYWLLGPGFGFTKPLKNLVLESLLEFPEIKNNLSLYNYPDDFWIALKASEINPVVITHKSTVWARSKEGGFWGAFKKAYLSHQNAMTLRNYLMNHK